MLSSAILKNLSAIYQIRFTSCVPFVEKGYRNKLFLLTDSSGNKYSLVFYKSEKNILQTIKNANLVSNFLSSKNFPVRKCIKTINGREIIKSEVKKQYIRYACLYNFLRGNTIAWDGWSMNHLKLAGFTLGEMHKALNNLNNPPLLNIQNIISNQYKKVCEYFENPEVLLALKNKLQLTLDFHKLNLLENHLTQVFKFFGKKKVTVLHMDYVRGNILFGESRNFSIGKIGISGIIDFEKVCIGHPVYDIARSMAFLITDSIYKTEEEIFKYFLEKGYIKRSKNLTKEDLPEPFLKTLLIFFWIYDFYKFLKHNPYEFLDQNEHFRRVNKKLLENKLLFRLY